MPSLDSLTPDRHQQIIMAMSANQNVVVKGVAGSGKSLILLKKAKQISTFSDSYVIIVYTKTLKEFFVDELAEIDQTGDHVYYFKEWERSAKPHVDYMFVDECQDFNAGEIEDFRNHGKYCWFFGDTDQSIMARNPTTTSPGRSVQSVEDTAQQIGVHTQSLGMNHRLTIENAKVGEYIKPATRLSMACYKHGPKPLQINSVSQLDEVVKIYQNNGFVDIGILAYYNNQIGDIKEYFRAKGLPIEWKTNDEMTIDLKSTNPKVITFHCAKGLQFENVFIPLCEKYNNRSRYANDIKNALYVACTRPLTQLCLVYSGNLGDFLPPATSNIYDVRQVQQAQNMNPVNIVDPDDLPF